MCYCYCYCRCWHVLPALPCMQVHFTPPPSVLLKPSSLKRDELAPRSGPEQPRGSPSAQQQQQHRAPAPYTRPSPTFPTSPQATSGRDEFNRSSGSLDHVTQLKEQIRVRVGGGGATK